ncbi:MAG: RsmD family RNA methyltransferase [bacterium]
MNKAKNKAILTILGGALKGEKIYIYTDEKLRPTRQMVREAAFQIWSDRIVGSVFLDPFAGSGAVILEALSRGAGEIYASDIRPDILFDIRKKLRDLERKHPGMAHASRFILSPSDFKSAFSVHFTDKRKFDLIYLDPPYGSGFGIESVRLISRYELLNDDGRIILEVSKREKNSVNSFLDEEVVFLLKQYKYGETYLYHFCLNEDY